MSTDYEKLGAFYLGREFDPAANALKDDLVLYDSKDLTTHAVCVGMTGSGKTGLCLSLLEEAAIDGVPAICIDPKGDLGNLLLTFPNLAPADFEPWVDAGDAARKGVSVAELRREDRRDLEEGPGRMGPGSPSASASCAPPPTWLSTRPAPRPACRCRCCVRSRRRRPSCWPTPGALRDRVGSVVSGLLSLLGIEADPIGSREHILLANILEGAWRAGLSLDMTGLIQAVQKPAFDKLGAFDLETFFPAKDRLKLAMQLNNLIASPGFATWMHGEPLDAQRLLFTAEGKPRISIISIAHLNDAERMFIVTLVLNEVDRVDARSVGHLVAARHPLHGRDLRLLPADRESAFQATHAHAAQAGARVRAGRACWRRRIPSISITRASPTAAPGSSAGCRPSATSCASSKA